jgi:hypothetical protein
MNILSFSRKACLILGACFAFNGIAEEPTVGEQFKKGAKEFGVNARDAAVDLGKTIGTGTKKAAKEIGNAFSKDVKNGGDGSAKRRNVRTQTSKHGRK